MQQSNVQVTAIAGFKGAFLDAFAKCELVFPKGFDNVGLLSRNLLALVIADGERASNGCLQRDAALHHRHVEADPAASTRAVCCCQPMGREGLQMCWLLDHLRRIGA